MRIAVLGTGQVGQTLAARFIALGHEVCMGSRTENNLKALTFIEKNGEKPTMGTFSNAAKFGEVVLNCLPGAVSVDTLASIEQQLAGKILIDVANPLDFSKGMPPGLIPSLSNAWSLGEALQKALPATQVVKTLNTMWCVLMVDPKQLADGDHCNFICGNDQVAKNKVKNLLLEMGWKSENLLDLGDLVNANGTEAYLPLWLSIYSKQKSAVFNIRLVQN